MRPSAAVAVAAALVGLVPATPAAAAAKPTHVAIVIAGHGVGCVRWHAGITGDEVLNDVATVKYRPTDGIITQIDGQPKNNRADTTHYWSYWHNTGSGWTYSTVGASSYHPKAGSVEGWHFINGSSTATPPPNRTYASICHDTAAPAPVATSSAAPTTHAVRTASSSASPRSPQAHIAGASSTASTVRPTSATPRSSQAAATGSSAAPVAAPAAQLPTLQARNTADATHHEETGSALPTVVVVALVLLLGGVTAFVAQRRRRST